MWHVKTRDDMGEEMKSEYPSTPEEAFEATIKGAIFGTQMHQVRMDRRECDLAHERGVPVNTFWDLGHNDVNAIWFHQRVGSWDHFIHYYEHRLVDITHYIEYLHDLAREHGYQWGTMYLPHDGKSRHIESVAGSAADILRTDGFKVFVVNRPIQKNLSIEPTRRAFSHCRFDKTECKDGIGHLDNYVFTWDEAHQTFRKTPAHTQASNGADAFQTYGFGYTQNEAERDARYGSRIDARSPQAKYRRALKPSTTHLA